MMFVPQMSVGPSLLNTLRHCFDFKNRLHFSVQKLFGESKIFVARRDGGGRVRRGAQFCLKLEEAIVRLDI